MGIHMFFPLFETTQTLYMRLKVHGLLLQFSKFLPGNIHASIFPCCIRLIRLLERCNFKPWSFAGFLGICFIYRTDAQKTCKTSRLETETAIRSEKFQLLLMIIDRSWNFSERIAILVQSKFHNKQHTRVSLIARFEKRWLHEVNSWDVKEWLPYLL